MTRALRRLVPALGLAAAIAAAAYRASRRADALDPGRPERTADAARFGQPAPSSPDQTPAPVFRTGIDFVRVDVIVTDKQGNPVGNLSQQDFEITEDGKPQSIQTFKLIDVKQATASAPVEPVKQIKSVIDEQAEAARDDVRVFAVFLDDYHVRKENSMRAREPIAQFIESQLQPTDMVGVMYPLTPLDEVLLTHNHANVASAIRNFWGRKYDYTPKNLFEERYVHYVSTMEAERIRNEVTLSAIKGLITHLGGLREGRKSLVLVSEGFVNSLPPQAQDAIAAEPTGGARAPDPVGGQSSREQSMEYFLRSELMGDIKLVYELANRYNTTIYAVDPRGLAPFEFDLSRSNVGQQADASVLENSLDTLRVLASETDGRAIVNQNDLQTGLRQIVRDSSAYYLLGYTTTQNATDGKFHEIKVRVKRPNLQVRARKGYLALSAAEAERATAPAKQGPPKAIADALGTLSNTSARRSLIRSWVGMSPGANGKTKVTFVWEPAPVAPGARRDTPARVSLVAGSPNADLFFRGRAPEPAPGRPSRVEFEVPPGPIDLDIAVEDANAEVLDRETRKVDVPSLGLGVTLSTPQVFRARTVREWQTLAGDPAAVPVPEREFRRTNRLLIRVGAQAAAGTATLSARLLNRDGDEMEPLTPAPAPTAGMSNIDLPLANLPPGEFLVEISASDGTEKTSALVAFRVTS